MKKAIGTRLIAFLMPLLLMGGCAQEPAEALKTDHFEGIVLGAPEGSGSVRTLKLRYRDDQGEIITSEIMNDVTGIVSAQYNSEEKEQIITSSDFNGDGIVEVIVLREFWFEDLNLPHAMVPQWPTVYEYFPGKGFVVASGKYKAWFRNYAQEQEELLARDHIELFENGSFTYHGSGDCGEALVAWTRLLYAARKIADGSFVPEADYAARRYQDVSLLGADVKQENAPRK